MTAEAAIAVAVPLRDEAAALPALLAALARQTGAPAFTLCLFLDNCTDGSSGVLAAHAPALPFPVRTARCDRGPPPNAGRARAAAMALALETAPGGILLTSDADSVPAADWIARNLAALERADLVAGRIVPDAPHAAQSRMDAYYERLHALRRAIDPVPWEGRPTHHWTSAASLGLRAATYHEIGGFPAIGNGEDAALCDAAARAGHRLRRDGHIVVGTSARRIGRASGGFAATLARLDGGEPATTHPADEAWRFAMQAEARRAHAGGDLAALAARLFLSIAEVERVAGECANGEAFAARMVGAPPGGMRTVGLAHAEVLLAAIDEQPVGDAA